MFPWVEALALATETTGFDGDDWLRRKQSNDQQANDDETSDKETTGFDGDDCLRRKQSNDQRANDDGTVNDDEGCCCRRAPGWMRGG
ncbi:unnamed protein product [Linum trigynum]|uniref:Uncharacterized protein n=1 Tax=Linum trigynum TaxID=586398 RepID=A0AAV2FUX0_9ROSI